MHAQVSKWGNSLAIRLPKAVAERLSVKEGQAVDLTIEGERVIIRSGQPRYSIEALVAQMQPGKEPESFDDVTAPREQRELLWAEGLAISGAVLADQVRSIDRVGRGLKIVGQAPESIVAEVQGKLAALFGITW